MEDNKIIQYHCPDFYFGQYIYGELIELNTNHPEYFYDDIRINCVFGAFPGMIWNGGGVIGNTNIPDINEIIRIKELYEFYNIPLKLTLTNPSLTKEDCYDRYCNKVVELMQNEHNMILVSSPILEEYLREKYPNYKYCKSIIASEFDCNYEQELEKYHEIVLPRRLVKDFDFLQTINEKNRSRFELLCNDPCPIDCPRLYSHYKDFAKVTLYEKHISEIETCTAISCTELRGVSTIKDQISYNEIINKYLPLGYNQFKLAGRGGVYNILHGLVKYFIKEEYQYETIFYLLNSCC